MYELFPVAAGVVVALLMRQIVDARLRGVAVAVCALVIGYAAATVSGEIVESKAFVLFDAGQTALATVVTMLVAARWRPASLRD
jgi:hypothetical protein